MQLTGAEIIIECLLEQSVDTVFGYPGGAILNVYDALYRYSDKIKHVLTSHEQGASHAADGYARATGKVGVCLATSGPGATNLVTGIATACMDSVPVVAITCNVGTALLGKDSFQEVDIAGIVMPVTKHSYIVKDVTKLADTIRKAFIIAKSGRPGPVLVDVPKDVTAAKCEYIRHTITAVEPKVDTIRPEDVDIVPPEQGHLCGTVTSVTFKGVHYDTIVDFKGFKWLIQTTDYCPVDAYIGIRLNPEDIHIMHKSEYSGLYGDYSSYSAEYDEIADASEEEADEE